MYKALTEKQVEIVHKALDEINNRRKSTLLYSDPRTGVSVAVTTNKKGKLRVGTALCSFEDRFVKPIGLVIALHRAEGRSIGYDYLHFDCDCNVEKAEEAFRIPVGAMR